jgi:F-type H+-transporting ATPase subunit b
MSLLIPETGLLFWMLLAFGVVFFVLAKYGWPAIVNMVEERSNFINNSVKIAEEAHLQLENIKLTSDNILSETRQKQMDILQEGSALRAKMIDEAKEQANANAEKIIASARLEIQKERDLALGDIRRQVAELSLEIAGKIVRQQLGNNEEQRKLVEKLLEEIKIQS